MGLGPGQENRTPIEEHHCIPSEIDKEEKSPGSEAGTDSNPRGGNEVVRDFLKHWGFKVPKPKAHHRAQAHRESGMPPRACHSLIKEPSLVFGHHLMCLLAR